MSSMGNRRSILAATALVAAGILAVGTATASNRGAPDIDALVEQLMSGDMSAPTTSPQSSASSQQSSASAWSQSGDDHGISVTTTTNGNSTSCMAVEWKRENGGIKKWQYRCDTPKQP